MTTITIVCYSFCSHDDCHLRKCVNVLSINRSAISLGLPLRQATACCSRYRVQVLMQIKSGLCVDTISGSAISLGSQSTTQLGRLLCLLHRQSPACVGCYSSSGKAIFAPGDGTYSNNYYTFEVQASGTTVTTPTIGYVVDTGSSTYIDLSSAFMATNQSVLYYCDNGNYSQLLVATATGYALAFGAKLNPTSASSASARCTWPRTLGRLSARRIRRTTRFGSSPHLVRLSAPEQPLTLG